MADSAGIQIIIPTAEYGARVDGLLADLRREAAALVGNDLSVFVVDAQAVHDVTGRVMGSDLVISLDMPSDRNGPAVNRNRGASRASAEWLVFLDDDVRLPINWLSNLRVVIEDPDAADVIGGDIGSQRPRNWYSQAAEDFVVRHREYPEGWFLAAAHLLVRSSAFEVLEGFDIGFDYGGEDWDLSRRAHALGLRVAVDSSIAVAHANATTWRELRRKAEQYGRANAFLDADAVAPVPLHATGAGASVSDAVAGGAPNASSSGDRVSPGRAFRWIGSEYALLRRLGRSRVRSARSALLQAAWMRTYLASYARARSEVQAMRSSAS